MSDHTTSVASVAVSSAETPTLEASLRVKRLALTLISTCHTLNHLQYSITSVIFPVMMKELGFGLLQLGALSAISNFVGQYSQLLVARVAIDAGSSPQHPLGSSILSRFFPKARGWALTFHHSAGSFGSFIGPGLASIALLYMGWQTAFVVFGIPSLVMGLTLFLVHEHASAADETRDRKGNFKANIDAYRACLKK